MVDRAYRLDGTGEYAGYVCVFLCGVLVQQQRFYGSQLGRNRRSGLHHQNPD